MGRPVSSGLTPPGAVAADENERERVVVLSDETGGRGSSGEGDLEREERETEDGVGLEKGAGKGRREGTGTTIRGELSGVLEVRLTLGSDILERQESPWRHLEMRDGGDREGGPWRKEFWKRTLQSNWASVKPSKETKIWTE